MARSMTFDSFVALVYMPWAKGRKKSWRTDESIWGQILSPAFGALQLMEITDRRITAWLDGLLVGSYSPASCNRYLSLLKSILNFACSRGHFPKGECPGHGVRPLRKTGPSQRFLTEDEASLLMRDLEGNPNPKAKAIQLIFLTGARKGEILKSRWEMLDLDRQCLKVNDRRTISLSDKAISIFRRLPRISPWCFPGRNSARPLADIANFWLPLRESLGLGNVRLLDLRHSFANFLAKSGSPTPEIQQMLGIATPGMVARYVDGMASPLAAANRITAMMGLG